MYARAECGGLRQCSMLPGAVQQLMEAIGRGGFGVVYRGLNVETGVTVAIKRVSLFGIPKDELESIEV